MENKTTKHTPGPWHYDGHGVNAEDGTRISKCSTRQWDENGKHDPVFEANSILQAAAPEMLEALQYVINWHREHDSGEGELFGLDFVTTSIAAVRKALGE